MGFILRFLLNLIFSYRWDETKGDLGDKTDSSQNEGILSMLHVLGADALMMLKSYIVQYSTKQLGCCVKWLDVIISNSHSIVQMF